jgi:hypothetical protein
LLRLIIGDKKEFLKDFYENNSFNGNLSILEKLLKEYDY